METLSTADFISSPSVWSQRKNRERNQCGPMIPSELWGDDNYSRPHITHAMSCTHKHTHFHTLPLSPRWLKMQNLIIPANHQPPELTHCGEPHCAWGHTPLTLPIQYTVHTHAHTYSYKCSPNRTLTSAQNRMLWNERRCWNLEKVAGSPLSHPPTHK